jgi:hypothetical protein
LALGTSAGQRVSFDLGSTGNLPVFFGSVPKKYVVGKLPTTAGWQPALPNVQRRDAIPRLDVEIRLLPKSSAYSHVRRYMELQT